MCVSTSNFFFPFPKSNRNGILSLPHFRASFIFVRYAFFYFQSSSSFAKNIFTLGQGPAKSKASACLICLHDRRCGCPHTVAPHCRPRRVRQYVTNTAPP